MLALAVGGLAGWMGYRNEVAAVTAAGKPPLTFRSAVRHVLTPKAERDAVKRLETMRQRAGRGELTPAERLECWQIIRNFSEEQVKVYLADLPPGNWYSANSTLTMMLFHRWGQLAPEAATREAMKEPYSKNSVGLPYAIMNAWMARDQDGAMRWVTANGSDSFKRIGGRIMGGLLVRQDPEGGLAKAEALGEAALGGALRESARQMANTPESRKAFYALQGKYGKSKEWAQAMRTLGYAAGERDAEELLTTVKGTGLPPEQSMKIRDTAISMLMRTEPQKAMEWTMAPASGTTREKQLSVFRSWASSHSKEATDWAVRNGRQDFIADCVREDGRWLVRNSALQWRERPKDGWAGAVADRYEIWQAHDPTGAAEWVKKMPSDIRKHLTGKEADVSQ